MPTGKKYDMKKKLLSLLLTLTIVATFMPAMTFASFAADKAPVYVGFTSDVHQDEGVLKADKGNADALKNWIGAVLSGDAIFDSFGICGDLGSGARRSDVSNYWNGAATVFGVLDDYQEAGKIKNQFVICGNHEYNPGKYTHEKNDTTLKYKDPGTTYSNENKDYILYSFGARDDREEFLVDDIKNLQAFLDQNSSFSRPIFILSHFPLHVYGNGKTEKTEANISSHDGSAPKNAKKVFDLLNSAADKGLNIFYIWGHNHSADHTYYDSFVTPNQTITIASDNAAVPTEISFTYAAAGTVRNEKVGGQEVQGKGFVAKIEEKKVTLTYYGAKGNDFGKTEITLKENKNPGGGDTPVNPGGGGGGGVPSEPEPTIDEVKAQATADVLAATGLTKAEELTGTLKTVYDKASEEIAAATEEADVASISTKYINLIKNVVTVTSIKAVQNKPSAKKNGKISVGFKTISYTNADNDNVRIYKYQVRRATNSGFTKNVKKYTKYDWLSSKVTFSNNKGLKKGKKYYYKVRGVVELADGLTVYTQWSDTKSVKCKKTRK